LILSGAAGRSRVSITSGKFTSARRTLWHRVRFQLGIALLLAVLIPYGIRYPFDAASHDLRALDNSLVGTLVALVAGYYAFRRMSHYPGVRASYHILPSFAASYGTALAVFFFARLDYSRLYFLFSFVLASFWCYIVYFKLQRQQRLTIGVVPFGEVQHLFDIEDVSWTSLANPKDAESPYDAIVADLRSLIPGIVYAKVKRTGDLILSLIALPPLLPVMLIVALLIRLDSAGPALFRQERMGYRGEVFRMFKFRSMREAGDMPDARTAAMTRDDDARVTRLGRVLRRYRIDELPQIINILKGEMSWIGPRPEAVALSQWYESELPFYRYRHIVRPGITGWAQVKQGHVADVEDVLWKLQYDFYYIKNFSFWLDLLIVARTIRTVLSGFGAR
jgi:lipopolysaccharide/colanic/teichoic acid biosynthesis glycosyltransferase